MAFQIIPWRTQTNFCKNILSLLYLLLINVYLLICMNFLGWPAGFSGGRVPPRRGAGHRLWGAHWSLLPHPLLRYCSHKIIEWKDDFPNCRYILRTEWRHHAGATVEARPLLGTSGRQRGDDTAEDSNLPPGIRACRSRLRGHMCQGTSCFLMSWNQ